VGLLIERVNVWIQVFTSLSVIAGFGLVLWQLELTRETSSAQYALLNLSDATADLNSVYGENAADVLAKACFNPDTLSDSDLIVLEHYFTNKIYRILNVFWQSRFEGTGDSWKGPASGFLSHILRYPQGVGFLEGFESADLTNSPVENFIEQQVTAGKSVGCDERLNRMRIK